MALDLRWEEGHDVDKYNEAATQFNFGHVRARYVRLDRLVNFLGTDTAVGLGEVKFLHQLPPRGTVVWFK
jgi:hypothetical protein